MRSEPEFVEAARRGAMDSTAQSHDYAVALCTYKGSEYVVEQLRSILDATPACSELVVVDDASGDETPDIIKATVGDLRARDVLVINPENIGSLRSFEHALRLTTAPIVFLSDQDDRWSEKKAIRMLREFELRPELLLLHTNARIVDEHMRPLGYDLFSAINMSNRERERIHSGDAFDAFIRRNVATGATVAIRRSLLDLALPIPEGWVHDEWLATIASAIGEGSVDFLDEQLIDYRQHGNNQIGARRLPLWRLLQNALHRDATYYSLQLSRTEALLERLVALGSRIPPDRVEKVRRKREHVRARGALPHSRLLRVIPVLKEMIAGRYARYSTGVRSIVTDLWRRA